MYNLDHLGDFSDKRDERKEQLKTDMMAASFALMVTAGLITGLYLNVLWPPRIIAPLVVSLPALFALLADEFCKHVAWRE